MPALLRPDAQLGEKRPRALEVAPQDAREALDGGDAAEHAVNVGVDALPVAEAVFLADEGVGRINFARVRHGI